MTELIFFYSGFPLLFVSIFGALWAIRQIIGMLIDSLKQSLGDAILSLTLGLFFGGLMLGIILGFGLLGLAFINVKLDISELPRININETPFNHPSIPLTFGSFFLLIILMYLIGNIYKSKTGCTTNLIITMIFLSFLYFLGVGIFIMTDSASKYPEMNPWIFGGFLALMIMGLQYLFKTERPKIIHLFIILVVFSLILLIFTQDIWIHIILWLVVSGIAAIIDVISSAFKSTET